MKNSPSNTLFFSPSPFSRHIYLLYRQEPKGEGIEKGDGARRERMGNLREIQPILIEQKGNKDDTVHSLL